MTFYLYAPPYNSCSGGIIALHKLAHNLTVLGQRAVLVSKGKNPLWLGEIQDDDIERDEDGVAIYPEIAVGNPYGLKKVVRWLLNTPGVMGGDGIYAPTDLVYKYADYFISPVPIKGILTAFDLQTDAFTDKGKHEQGKVCFMVRKGTGKPFVHGGEAVDVGDYSIKGGHDYLSEVFDSCETFISYDHANFCSVFAALSGCRSVVIPDGHTTKEQWKKQFPYFQYGVDYGVDDHDGLHTQGLVRNHLKALEEISIEQTKQLIKDCNEASISNILWGK